MPSGFASLDTGFPDLSGYSSTEQKLQAMEDYLVQLLEQLRYVLHNLGMENLNPADVQELGEIITGPIRAEIDDPETGLSARITANADAISAEVSRAAGAEGSLSSRVTQTAEAITAEVSRAAGAESALSQTAEAIRAQVTDGNGNYTVVNLRSDGLHIGSDSGTTTIDGGYITAGTVTADRINTAGLEAESVDAGWVYAGAIEAGQISAGKINANNVGVIDAFEVWHNVNGTLVPFGYMGAAYGDDGTGSTWGVMLKSPYTNSYLIVTDSGVRLQVGNRSLYVTGSGIYARAGGKTVELMDLEARVAALEGTT